MLLDFPLDMTKTVRNLTFVPRYVNNAGAIHVMMKLFSVLNNFEYRK